LNHSDIFIVASLGIETNHLFSFFKKLSVFELIMDQNERLKLLDNKEIQKRTNKNKFQIKKSALDSKSHQKISSDDYSSKIT